MARIVRRRLRRKQGAATPGASAGTRGHRPPERGVAAVILLGGSRFRALVSVMLAATGRMRVVAETGGEDPGFAPALAPRSDVVLVEAGRACPSRTMDIARAIQHRQAGAGVVVVIESLSEKHLAEYWWELCNWSLAAPATCAEPGRLLDIVECTVNGIRWVEPRFGRLLEQAARAGGARVFGGTASRDVPDFAVVHGQWSGRVRKAPGTERSEGAWLGHPGEPPGRLVV